MQMASDDPHFTAMTCMWCFAPAQTLSNAYMTALHTAAQMVGAILAEDAKPLPADLSTFLVQGLSSGHAAVYVSMGTLAMPSEEELQSMVQGLSALPNPVLWKLDSQLLPGAALSASTLLQGHLAKRVACK